MTGFGGFDTGLKVHDQAHVIIPEDVIYIMNGILSQMTNKGDEVGIFMKGELDKSKMTFEISDAGFYLPQQTVTPASIRFDEDPPSLDYNCVIHRHPNGVNNFSGTDRSSINKEFDCSILFIPPTSFPAAIINVQLDEFNLIQMPARVSVRQKKIAIDQATVRSKVRGMTPQHQRRELDDTMAKQETKGLRLGGGGHGSPIALRRKPGAQTDLFEEDIEDASPIGEGAPRNGFEAGCV